MHVEQVVRSVSGATEQLSSQATTLAFVPMADFSSDLILIKSEFHYVPISYFLFFIFYFFFFGSSDDISFNLAAVISGTCLKSQIPYAS